MSRDYKVGKGKPPAEHRFPKGVSGNPKGRPKGSLNIETELTRALNERVAVKEGDRVRRASKLRAVVLRLVQKAMNGDGNAGLKLIELVLKHVPEDPRPTMAPNKLSEEDEAILNDFMARQREATTATASENTSDETEQDRNG